MRNVAAVVLTVLGLGLGVGCGAENGANGGSCDPSLCAGCCSADGECLDGTSVDACGSAGRTCETCTGDEVCEVDGCAVPPDCNPENCDGCCQDGACITTAGLNSACGTGGNQCQDCTATNSTCDGIQCVVACGPDNCAGCCLNGMCVEDIGDETCGSGGGQCSDCAADGQVCKDGACAASTCANTCAGCCDGDTCIDPATNSQCGIDGSTCTDCAASGGNCSFGQCISNTCAATCGGGCCSGDTCKGGDEHDFCGSSAEACIQCGANEVCSDGACTIGPNSLWDIEVVSAQVPLKDENGDAWDSFGGLPDPYVRTIAGEGTSDEVQAETVYVSDSISGTYDETVLTDVPARAIFQNLVFEWLDSDTLTDTSMHVVRTSVPASLFSSSLLVVTSGEFKVYFRLKAH